MLRKLKYLLLMTLSFGFSLFAKESVEEVYPVAIFGSGVGGLTSALYLCRADIHPVIIEGNSFGGLITQSHMVENWPTEPKISGVDLIDKLKAQVDAYNCKFLSYEVIDVDFSTTPFIISIRDLTRSQNVKQIKAYSCIIAMGASSNYLNVPGEATFWGKGVSNCATCDGILYKGKNVAVIGGSDSAILEANYLSNLAKKVYLVVRKEELKGMDAENRKNLLGKANVAILYNTAVRKIDGNDDKINQIVVEDLKEKRTYNIMVDGVFTAIGSTPNTTLFKDKLNLDDKGYIVVNSDHRTSIKGVFAVGDITDPIYKQAITAAGDGAQAAMRAIQYLEKVPQNQIVKSEYRESNQNYEDKPIEIQNTEQFNKELNSSSTSIIADFYATWCGPCRRVSPVVEAGAKNLSGKVKILKINVDKCEELCNKYDVRGMPTIIVFKPQGEILFKRSGQGEITKLIADLEKMQDKSANEIIAYLESLAN
ncbi:MAG: FAD-dependent oxidoreductase [Chlamydiae bacterium]|nr:FAD-dependent oxidoreductase [Chlamydiota bacterium]